MQVHPDDPRLKDPNRPKMAPIEYAGKWVAWDDERQNIVASGTDMEEVYQQAIAVGNERPLLQKVRRADRLYIG